MGAIHLGCSGWDYRDWADVFYKRTEESKLRAYSHIFNTGEIISTFYSYPAPGIVFGWAKHTPPDFKFAVKLNRLITHENMLDLSKGVEDDLRRFCELMKPLKETEKLSSHNVAAVAVDEPLLPPEIRRTSDIAYVRWHGRGKKMWYNYRYSKDELEEWMPGIREMARNAQVYGYFNS